MGKKRVSSSDEPDNSVFVCTLEAPHVAVHLANEFRLNFMARLLAAGIALPQSKKVGEVTEEGLMIDIFQRDYARASEIAKKLRQEMGILNGRLMPYAESA